MPFIPVIRETFFLENRLRQILLGGQIESCGADVADFENDKAF